MTGSKFRPLLREFLGSINREIRIALTPVPHGKKWVFVVGCYNSGTTLLANILSGHPQVSALPTEGHFITDEFIKDYDIGLPRMWVDREDLFRLTESDEGPDPTRLKKEWGMRLDLRKNVLLEKSPPNSARVRWLQANFEDAHFIGIVRNPYAVAEGITRKAKPKHLKNGWPIEKSAFQWSRSNEILYQDARLLRRFIWVSYEDFTEDPAATILAITDFVGIEPFESFDSEKSLSIHERNESIRNMNKESIDRLSADEIRLINKVAGQMIDKLGYDRIELD